MRKYADVVLSQTATGLAQPVVGASVQVLGHVSQTNATIYSDDGVTTTGNPLTTDAQGRYQFYVANGRYDIKITAVGFTTFTLTDIDIHDETDITVPGETPLPGNLIFTGTNTAGKWNGVCIVDGVQNATLAAAVTCAGTLGTIEIPIFSVPALTGNVTIPVGVTLKFDGPSGITTTGFTLTVNGPIVAPPTQIFFGTGTVNLGPLASPVHALWFPGADIGAQINSAYAALPAQGGTILIEGQSGGGCYNFSTPIVLNTSNKYPILQGVSPVNSASSGGACINYTPTIATTALTLDYTPTGGGGFVPGSGVFNLALTNNGCVTNGGCGSSATGILFGTTNAGAHMAKINARVSGFGTAVSFNASTGWGVLLDQFNCSWNTTCLTFPSAVENVKWVGGSCSVNTTCINMASVSDMSLFGVSIDSNTTVGYTGTGNITFSGCHFENLNQSNVQYITMSGGSVTLSGGLMLDDSNSGTAAQMITMTAGFLDMQGVALFSAGRTITNLVNNTAGGVAYVDVSSSSASKFPLPLCSTAAACTIQSKFSAFTGIDITTWRAPVDIFGASGAAGYIVCHMDAVNNDLRCNYNNSGFSRVPLVGAANAWTGVQSYAAGTILPTAVNTTDLGSTSLPFVNLWLGTAATNNFKFQPAATAAARVVQINDPGTTPSALLLGGTNLLVSPIAPTFSTHFNTSGDSIVSNGTASFAITTGTGTGTSTGSLNLPTATTGWTCWLTNTNRAALIQQTGSTTATATFTNFGTTFAATNWTNGDVLRGGCTAN